MQGTILTLKKILLLLIVLFSTTCIQAQEDKYVKSVDNTEFKKLIHSKDVILVDVRTPREFKEGHIPNALNLDYRSEAFSDNIKKLKKEKTIAVYCRSGSRSKMAAKKLIEEGFDVYELNKGIMNWDGAVSEE
ncbi:MAG: rhodanese-like domain-containing protein [Bacteroidales bacterium]